MQQQGQQQPEKEEEEEEAAEGLPPEAVRYQRAYHVTHR